MAPTVHPLTPPPGSDIDFGAVVDNVDLENLTDDDFSTIHDALYKHLVVVVKNQQHLTPRAQYELTRRFDPAASSYGHGKTIDAKRSILHPDLKTVPHQPQVQVIGHGHVASYEGLTDIQLRHPHHRTFHRDPIPDAEDHDFTRFYRWHIDAALYGLHPPRVTTLLAVRVPRGRRQTLRYDDGSHETLDVPLGTTAFVSGERMYSRLSAADKEFVRTSRVEYAPHPYIWMSPARALPTGLGLYSEDRELAPADLPPIDPAKIQILPMLWKNPVTGHPALQIHPSAVRKIHLKDGSVIDDLRQVRDIVYRLQRPAISPQYVYPHDWEEGDLVLFHNRGVLHSVVGAFGEGEVRLFRQCNLAAGEAPVGME
ncbi:TauD/TfdA family dioxygenase [Aspergillus fijiensis CBS 313.89]|uniref:Alpha-ketoglutarate-dependent xanthine dioxygenase xanA n=1 Tax=Aspergillus fijiensis CBS 313.89 TaxID=1448319 RepID=A0A8G1RZ48_9EURO|nr:alpha-ketoglutarate dependent xanthine dioxygenase [Aspergillus fijiensis CBS 313.89]RAK81402.1 alpha-ketoglutarate dependent xanthine dioxygenase [Aspergillus fijiensis CBS 313.89]